MHLNQQKWYERRAYSSKLDVIPFVRKKLYVVIDQYLQLMMGWPQVYIAKVSTSVLSFFPRCRFETLPTTLRFSGRRIVRAYFFIFTSLNTYYTSKAQLKHLEKMAEYYDDQNALRKMHNMPAYATLLFLIRFFFGNLDYSVSMFPEDQRRWS